MAFPRGQFGLCVGSLLVLFLAGEPPQSFGQFMHEPLGHIGMNSPKIATPKPLLAPTMSPTIPCPVKTVIHPNSNESSYIIQDRIYDMSKLSSSASQELLSILVNVRNIRCISIRVQTQMQDNSSVVEGEARIYCGLRFIGRVTLWISSNGCTDFFLENVRMDLERCATVNRSRSESMYTFTILSDTEWELTVGMEQLPKFVDSTLQPNASSSYENELLPAAIEEMFKCDCTAVKEAFKTMRDCVILNVTNVSKLVLHIALIITISIGTTLFLLVFLKFCRKLIM